MMFGTLSGGDCRRVERWLSWLRGWNAANYPSGVSYIWYIYWYKFRNKALCDQVNIFGNVTGGRHGVQLFQVRLHGFSWNTSIVRRIRFVSMAADFCTRRVLQKPSSYQLDLIALHNFNHNLFESPHRLDAEVVNNHADGVTNNHKAKTMDGYVCV